MRVRVPPGALSHRLPICSTPLRLVSVVRASVPDKEGPMRRFRLPSPSMTVACVALAVALGGTSYAAIKIPRNSVGTKQLRNSAVTSAKVKNSSLRIADFSSSQRTGLVGPIGPVGPPGPTGATGAAGAAGAAGSALAFAHVNNQGTLDSARSKNVGGVSHPQSGAYCFTRLPASVTNLGGDDRRQRRGARRRQRPPGHPGLDRAGQLQQQRAALPGLPGDRL